MRRGNKLIRPRHTSRGSKHCSTRYTRCYKSVQLTGSWPFLPFVSLLVRFREMVVAKIPPLFSSPEFGDSRCWWWRVCSIICSQRAPQLRLNFSLPFCAFCYRDGLTSFQLFPGFSLVSYERAYLRVQNSIVILYARGSTST